jgi:hypothetical protein
MKSRPAAEEQQRNKAIMAVYTWLYMYTWLLPGHNSARRKQGIVLVSKCCGQSSRAVVMGDTVTKEIVQD